jgi:cyclic beta-1,2-glucan synthetase
MHQAAVQSLLGFRRHGATLSVSPRIPSVWPHYSLEVKIGSTQYRFVVSNPEHQSQGVASAELDGYPVDAGAIPLVDDGGVHEVSIVLGSGLRVGRPLAAAAVRRDGAL